MVNVELEFVPALRQVTVTGEILAVDRSVTAGLRANLLIHGENQCNV